MVSFAEPARLWLLLAPAAAALAVAWRHRARRRDQRRLASPGVWRRVMGGAPATGAVRLGAWLAAAVLLALALARPQWGEAEVERSLRARDLVIAVDVSDSMRCTDLRPSRLERVLSLIGRALPELEGNRVGVVVFAGDAYALVPLTTDLEAVGTFLSGVESGMVGLPGSNLERAVGAAVELLPPAGEGRVVVLVSDGENLQGDPAAAAARLAEGGVAVVGVVAGTESGGPIPILEDGRVRYKRDAQGQPVVTRARRETLAALAERTGGEVLAVDDRDALLGLAAAVERIRTREEATTRRVERVERFPIFLAGAVAAVLAGFAASPWRRLAAAAMLLTMIGSPAAWAQQPPGQGATVAEEAAPPAGDVPWWQRLLPGGSRRLAREGAARWREGDPEGAAAAFAGAARLAPENGERLYDLGTALAGTGRVEPAAGPLGAAHAAGVPDAAYNLGTTALAGGQAEPAVTWLRAALLAAPDDPEVKRNYELALRLLEQQQNEQQDEQQQQQEQEQEQESESGGGPPPTPTPDTRGAIYSALERAEEEAREQMQKPTPQAATVEKDW